LSPKAINLRKLAKGKECQVRLAGICNHDDTTTVLAHIRRGGIAGMGLKPPDIVSTWACSECHACIDGRAYREVAAIDREYAILHGMCRTLVEVSKALGL